MPDLILIKTIKPRKLDPQAVIDEITAAATAEAQRAVKLFERTVTTWSKRLTPRFEYFVEVDRAAGQVITVVGPGGSREAIENWLRLDEGVPPDGKRIYPVTPGVTALRFRETYDSKSLPGVLDAREGGGSGEFIYRRSVRHLPNGIEARNWSVLIQRQRQRPYNRAIFRAMQQGMRKKQPT